jgi:hypothetical protein
MSHNSSGSVYVNKDTKLLARVHQKLGEWQLALEQFDNVN